MSGLCGRWLAAFVAPADAEARVAGPVPDDVRTRAEHEASSAGRPEAVAVLCRPDDGAALGAAVALALAPGTVVVALWGAAPAGARAPATPRARRLAARLASRGHAARACGRLVVVALGADAGEAGRVGAASDAPLVTVLAGPRDTVADALLAAQDRVLVAAAGPLAAVVLEGVEALGVRAVALDPPGARAAAARALAAGGAMVLAPLREPVRAALC